MYKTQFQEVTKRQEVTIAVICDECLKEQPGKTEPDNWHRFFARHGEWGNDSCDSVQEYLVCSPECYYKHLSKVIEEFEPYKRTAFIDDRTIHFAKLMIEHLNKQ